MRKGEALKLLGMGVHEYLTTSVPDLIDLALHELHLAEAAYQELPELSAKSQLSNYRIHVQTASAYLRLALGD